MATYAIGDIHGTYHTVLALLEKLRVNDEDTLILCGDLVDRGPRIKQVLDWALERPNTMIVIGNHDFSFMDWFTPGGRIRNQFMYDQGLSDTLQQLAAFDAQDYARRLRDKSVPVVRDMKNRYVFCHADYNWVKGEEFDYNHLWNRIDGVSHRDYVGPIIVHGHTPCALERAIERKADGTQFGLNIDGGSTYKNYYSFACLRALNVDTGELIEQPALD